MKKTSIRIWEHTQECSNNFIICYNTFRTRLLIFRKRFYQSLSNKAQLLYESWCYHLFHQWRHLLIRVQRVKWTSLQLVKQYDNKKIAAILKKRNVVVARNRANDWFNTKKYKFRRTNLSSNTLQMNILRMSFTLFIHYSLSIIFDFDRMILINHSISTELKRFYFEIEIDFNISEDVELINDVAFVIQSAHLNKMLDKLKFEILSILDMRLSETHLNA